MTAQSYLSDNIEAVPNGEPLTLIGNSDALRAVRTLIEQVAPMDVPVLIVGESGTGKEVVARLIHAHSRRARQPFVPVNCAAIPEGLFESEMFGIIRGAYTGADRSRPGLFEQANKGTLLLDEIGEMPLSIQVKLLRVLETGIVMRLGGTNATRVDVRLISSTNRDLARATADNKFRVDLYYRVRAVQIELPPLRDRPEDIPLLITHFAAEFASRNHIAAVEWARATLNWLAEQRWEGNVRELRWFVEGYLSLDRPSGIITLDRVQPLYAKLVPTSRRLPVLVPRGDTPSYETLDETELETGGSGIARELQELRREVRELKGMVATALLRYEERRTEPRDRAVEIFATVQEREQSAIREALAASLGNRREAARKLGISERTLYRKLKQMSSD